LGLVIALLAVAALAESFALPGWVTEEVRPQLTVAIVIGWGILRGWEEGAIVGVAAGFFAAFASATPVGVPVVRLAVVGLLAGLGLPRLAQISALVLFVAGFVGSLVSFVISVLGLQAAGWTVSWERDLLFNAMPSAILTALATLVCYRGLQIIERLTTAQTEEPSL
jgi:rod shape-determining protein MreD